MQRLFLLTCLILIGSGVALWAQSDKEGPNLSEEERIKLELKETYAYLEELREHVETEGVTEEVQSAIDEVSQYAAELEKLLEAIPSEHAPYPNESRVKRMQEEPPASLQEIDRDIQEMKKDLQQAQHDLENANEEEREYLHLFIESLEQQLYQLSRKRRRLQKQNSPNKPRVHKNKTPLSKNFCSNFKRKIQRNLKSLCICAGKILINLKKKSKGE